MGDKYPTDVGHVQLSVSLGVGHVLSPMTSVPAGVISTTPVTVVSAALPETTLTQTMPQMLPQKLPQMITQNSSQLLTQNISQITTQNITPFVMKQHMHCKVIVCIRIQIMWCLDLSIREA